MAAKISKHVIGAAIGAVAGYYFSQGNSDPVSAVVSPILGIIPGKLNQPIGSSITTLAWVAEGALLGAGIANFIPG